MPSPLSALQADMDNHAFSQPSLLPNMYLGQQEILRLAAKPTKETQIYPEPSLS